MRLLWSKPDSHKFVEFTRTVKIALQVDVVMDRSCETSSFWIPLSS